MVSVLAPLLPDFSWRNMNSGLSPQRNTSNKTRCICSGVSYNSNKVNLPIRCCGGYAIVLPMGISNRKCYTATLLSQPKFCDIQTFEQTFNDTRAKNYSLYKHQHLFGGVSIKKNSRCVSVKYVHFLCVCVCSYKSSQAV